MLRYPSNYLYKPTHIQSSQSSPEPQYACSSLNLPPRRNRLHSSRHSTIPRSMLFNPPHPLVLILSTCTGRPERARGYGQGVCQLPSVRCDEEEPGDYFGPQRCSSGGYEEGWVARPTFSLSGEELMRAISWATGVDVTSPPSKMTMLSLAFDTEFRTAIEKVSTHSPLLTRLMSYR